jgi:5-methylthioadenosine/S-adenosylhomocysteine deaminase
MAEFLLTGATVITMDETRRVIQNGAVAVDQGRIVFVGPAKEAAQRIRAREVLDLTDHAVLPGLIDSHGHGGHSLMKGVVVNSSVFMPAMTHMYKNYTTAHYWYTEGKLSALERLKAGVTTGVSVMGSQPRCDEPDYALAHARAYMEMGTREIVATGPCAPPWPHRFSDWRDGVRVRREVTYEHCLQSLERVIQQCHHAANDRIRAFVTPFSLMPSINGSAPTAADRLTPPTPLDLRQSREMRRIAKEYGTRIHTDAFGGAIHMAAQDPNALLGPDVLMQHCIGCSKDEIKILADTGTHVGSSPGGTADVATLLMLGVNVVITSDGPKLNGGADMFQAARAFQAGHRKLDGDPFYLPSEKILEMITIDAAKALGWDDEIGSLQVGKKADIIAVDMRHPRLMPRLNPVHMLVGNAQASDVDYVWVDGKLLVRERQVLGVDEMALLNAGDEAAKQVIQAAHLDKFADLQEHAWGQYKQYHQIQRFDLDWSRQDGGYY